jgi:two-component sensor histidine kinase
MTIRFRLGLAVALALLPVLLLGAVQSYSEFRRDAEARRTRLVEAAQRSAAGAGARVAAAVATLEAISPQTVGANCAPLLSSLVKKQLGYSNAVSFDAAGRVRCAAGLVREQPDLQNTAWFRKLAGGGALAVFRAPARIYGPEPGVVAATAVTNAEGRFDGVLAVVLKLDSLRPDLTDPTLPRGTQVGVADEGGRLLIATDPSAFGPLPKGAGAEPVVFEGKDAGGRDRVEVLAPLLEQEAFVVLSAPKPGLAGFARLNPVATVVFPLLAWILAWVTVWIAADRVVIRWLHYLDRIASFYAKGRFSVRAIQAESAPEEIRSLAHTLDTMADAIVHRDLSLRDSLAHKDALMREIHHRVKNNLQVITSLLNMQQRSLTDPAARAAMSDTRQRITALALIYRALYQSPDLSRVDVRQFLEELIAQMVAGEGGHPSPIRTELEADDLEIDPDKLAPLALFAVEAITAARKHAQDGGGATIHVRFAVEPEQVILEIADDGTKPLEGAGLDAAGVGRTLMTAFARQLRGQAAFSDDAPGEHLVRLTFPRPEPAAAAPPAEPEPPPSPPKPASRKRSGNQAPA